MKFNNRPISEKDIKKEKIKEDNITNNETNALRTKSNNERYYEILMPLITRFGVYPYSELKQIGNELMVRKLVAKMIDKGILIKKSFKDKGRVVKMLKLRKSKESMLIAGSIYENSYKDYLENITRFAHGEYARFQRGAATTMTGFLLHKANIPIYPPERRPLQVNGKNEIISLGAYLKRELPEPTTELEIYIQSKVNMALITPNDVFAVYNVGDTTIGWSAAAEYATATLLKSIKENNTLLSSDTNTESSALIVSSNYKLPKEIFSGTKRTLYIDDLYKHYHFLPNDINGIIQLKIMKQKDYIRKLFTKIFGEYKNEVYNIDADYCIRERDEEGKEIQNKISAYVLYGFDLNLTRIRRFLLSKQTVNERLEIMCFDWQSDILIDIFGDEIDVNVFPSKEDVLAVYGLLPKNKKETETIDTNISTQTPEDISEITFEKSSEIFHDIFLSE